MTSLRFASTIFVRATCPAFHPDAEIAVKDEGSALEIVWRHAGCEAALTADFASGEYQVAIR